MELYDLHNRKEKMFEKNLFHVRQKKKSEDTHKFLKIDKKKTFN